MKTKLLVICIGFMVLMSLAGQNQTDSVIIIKTGIMSKFVQKQHTLSASDLMKVTKNNTAAHKKITMANINYYTGVVCIAGGAAIAGSQLGGYAAGEDLDPVMLGISAGLAVMYIPFYALYVNSAKKGIKIYNKGLTKTTAKNIKLEFGMTGHGVGVKVRF